MKILILRTAPDKPDHENYNLQELGLAKALVRKGMSCDVAYYCGREKFRRERIEFDEGRHFDLLWLPGFGLLREGFFPGILRIVEDYDIIQISEYIGITSFYLSLKFPDRIVYYQGPYYCKKNRGDIIKAFFFDRLLLPFMLKKGMTAAAKSKLAEAYLRKKGIADVRTLGVGLDTDNFNEDSTAEEKCPLISELKNKRSEEGYLLYIGAMEERRDIIFLLNTFKLVTETMPGVRLVLVGKGEKAYVSDCFKEACKLGIREKIIYREKIGQKYLPSVYRSCDMFIFPTDYEIFGMVMLEAMYFGLPVITTFNGGSSTLIDGENGLILRDKSKELWSFKIIELLRERKTRSRMGEKAHQTVLKGFTWDALADDFASLYRGKAGKEQG